MFINRCLLSYPLLAPTTTGAVLFKNNSNASGTAPGSASFKSQNSFEERQEQFRKITSTHPNKVPVIVERAPSASGVPEIDKNKYLVPGELTMAQFLCLIRKRIKLSNDQSLFIYINGTLPATSALFNTIYEEHRDSDGFLYVLYTGESSFGQ